jgi:hypothetical protein
MVDRAIAGKPTAIQVFVEGGGNSRDEQTEIRRGFATLFSKLLGVRAKPKVVCSGSRNQAFKEWERAIKTHPETLSLLLVDSEGPILPGVDPWDHVSKRAGDTHWQKPPHIDDDCLFFMVQTMEAWFMADKQALVSFYGTKHFQVTALPDRPNVENIPKQELEKTLAHASRDTTKGAYEKSHGFAIVGLLDPTKVRAASPHAARFFDKLLAVCPMR